MDYRLRVKITVDKKDIHQRKAKTLNGPCLTIAEMG